MQLVFSGSILKTFQASEIQCDPSCWFACLNYIHRKNNQNVKLSLLWIVFCFPFEISVEKMKLTEFNTRRYSLQWTDVSEIWCMFSLWQMMNNWPVMLNLLCFSYNDREESWLNINDEAWVLAFSIRWGWMSYFKEFGNKVICRKEAVIVRSY